MGSSRKIVTTPPSEEINNLGYDFDKYPGSGLTGFAGLPSQRIVLTRNLPAERTRLRGLYKTGLAQMPDGSLVLTPCHVIERPGQPYEIGKDLWISAYRSDDAGRTWEEVCERALLGKEPGLTCLKSGVLLMSSQYIPGDGTYYYDLSRSVDGGRTWESRILEPMQGARGPKYVAIPARQFVEQPDGTVLFFVGAGSDMPNDIGPSRAWVCRSKDQGESWQIEEIRSWKSFAPMFTESSMIRLPSGKLLAASRVEGAVPRSDAPPPRVPYAGGEEAGHMVLMESDDGGANWSAPRDFLWYAEVHAHLALLKDGRILCTYATYKLPWGVAAVISADGGKTWNLDNPVQLAWSSDCYVGWATSLPMADGSIFTAATIRSHSEPDQFAGYRGNAIDFIRWRLPW